MNSSVRPIVLQTRPLRWADVAKCLAIGAVLIGVGFGWGYLWPRPERQMRPSLIDELEQYPAADETVLYPTAPYYIMRRIDGTGAYQERLVTADGRLRLREWIDREGGNHG